MAQFQPGYLTLYPSGELRRRTEALESRLVSCDLCPHTCRVNRLQGEVGFCHSRALPVVASICAHHGEEPPISGTGGSGAVFFGNCNMRCVYCQNHQISQSTRAQTKKEMNAKELARQLIYLQDELHCHNINFVSPSHFVPQLVRAVLEAIPLGLRIPLVYNTGGYDSLVTLKLLEGIIDIYLPDIRYADNKIAWKYSRVRDYVSVNRAAITEMYRQTGNLMVDDAGVAIRGLIVRHLILPEALAGSEDSLKWLAGEISPEITVSIMAQYYPAHRVAKYPEINRRITPLEYEKVTLLLEKLGMDNGWLQELDSPDTYLPDFARDGHPFQS